MKILKYAFIVLLALSAVSCVEEPILHEDDPIVHPPPPPKP